MPPKRAWRAAASSSSRAMNAAELALGEEALDARARRARRRGASSPARWRRSSSAVAVARSFCASGSAPSASSTWWPTASVASQSG